MMSLQVILNLPMVLLDKHPLLVVVYALAIYAFAATCSWVFVAMGISSLKHGPASRYGNLDGLRGLLAVGVMIHHSHAAYIYYSGEHWDWSGSAILNQLGQTTVAIFFMITGFLFSLKVMHSGVKWGKFFLARIMRLAPLYFLVVGVIVLVVFYLANWKLQVPLVGLLVQILQWLAFVCFGRPDINLHADTWILMAGVNWSLKYEVLFYIVAVPLLRFGYIRLGVLGMSRVVISLLLLFLLARANDFLQGGNSLYLTQFLAGIAVAHFYQSIDWRRRELRLLLNFLACAAFLILTFKLNANNSISIISGAILLLAAVTGEVDFGILKARPIVWLGEVSYGIYLLHGLVLVALLSQLSGVADLRSFGVFSYLGVLLVAVVIVVSLATLSFLQFERPLMQWVASGRSTQSQ